MKQTYLALAFVAVLLLGFISHELYIIRGVQSGRYAMESQVVSADYKAPQRILLLERAGYRFAGMSEGSLRYERVRLGTLAASLDEQERARVQRVLDGPGDK